MSGVVLFALGLAAGSAQADTEIQLEAQKPVLPPAGAPVRAVPVPPEQPQAYQPAPVPAPAPAPELGIIPVGRYSSPPPGGYNGPKFGLVVGGAFEFGGAKVAIVEFTNGDHQNIRAGQGVSGFIGGGVRLNPKSPWSARLTVGYKYYGASASNADINLTRVPIELIGSYELSNGFRAGAGIDYHTAIRLQGDQFFDTLKFNDAVGPKFELGWRFVVVNYTHMHYTADGIGHYASASNFGVTFIGEFGMRKRR